MTERTSAIRGWLEVTANLGIVIGLMLVALQIAQQDDLAFDDKVSESFILAAEYNQQFVGEDAAASFARAIDDPATLSTRDHVVLYRMYMAEFTKSYRWAVLEPDQAVAASQVARWLGLTANPYGYAWWNATDELLGPLTPKLRAAVDRELARRGPAHADSERQIMGRIATLLLEAPPRQP